MKCLLQRVSRASVTIDGRITGAIDHGLVVLVGIAPADDAAVVDWMAKKIVNLRIFNDDDGRFNRSLTDVGGSILSISQFTLYGDARKGTRPSFTKAAPPEHADDIWQQLNSALSTHGVPVETGIFGAHMQVELCNDGPVTLELERTS